MSAAELLTYDALANATGVRSGTLKRWKHEGMPAVTLEGHRVRFLRAEVEAWIEWRRTDPNKLRRLRSVTFSRHAVIYFGIDDEGRIKIGWTSNQLRRADELGIEVLATVAGDKTIEALFHLTFADDQIEDEWFRASPRLRAFIDGLVKMPRTP